MKHMTLCLTLVSFLFIPAFAQEVSNKTCHHCSDEHDDDEATNSMVRIYLDGTENDSPCGDGGEENHSQDLRSTYCRPLNPKNICETPVNHNFHQSLVNGALSNLNRVVG